MRKFFLPAAFVLVFGISNAQTNVGIGTNLPLTKLDINGALALREGTAISLANGGARGGINDNIALPVISGTSDVASFYRITGPSAVFSVYGIVPATGADGEVVTLVNVTGKVMTVINNNSSTPANGIVTQTGANLVDNAGATANSSITLQYNKSVGKWYVTGTQNYVTNTASLITNSVVPGASSNALSVTNGSNQVVGATNLTLNVAKNAVGQDGVVPGTATPANNNQVWGTNGSGVPAWGSVGNAQLANSAITIANGGSIGISGSPVSLGGTITLTNNGVTAISSASPLTSNVSATGAVTVNLTGIVPIANGGTNNNAAGLGTANNFLIYNGTGITASSSNAGSFAPASGGNYLAKNSADVSSVNVATGGGNLYQFTQSNTTAATANRSVVDLVDNVTTPGAFDYLLRADNAGTNKFAVSSNGNTAIAGTGTVTGLTTLNGGVTETGAINLNASGVTNPVANINTNSTGTLTIGDGSSGASTVDVKGLTANAVVLNNGSGMLTSSAWGASNTVLHGQGGTTAPTFAQVGLTTDVTGILPVANGGTGSATQGWIDLVNAQTAAGVKTWSSNANFGGTITMNGTTQNTNQGLEWYYGTSDRYGIVQSTGGGMTTYTSSGYATSFISFALSGTGVASPGAPSGSLGAEFMRITHAGNVGIGTTNPSSMFSVGSSSQFQVNSSGNIVNINNVATSWPASQGGASTVLTNNGSGALSWTAVTGSGSLIGSGTQNYISKWNNAAGTTLGNSGILDNGTTVSTTEQVSISTGATQLSLAVNGTNNPEIELQSSGAARLEIAAATAASAYITNSAVGDVIFRQTNAGKILFSTSASGSTNDLTLNAGSVGIGTTAPRAPLEVSTGSGDVIKVAAVSGGSGNTGNIAFTTYTDAGGVGARIQAIDDGNFGAHLAFQTYGGGTANSSATVERMRITDAGSVGVGITGPIARLDVQGPTARSGTAPTSPSFYVTGTLTDGTTGPASGNIEFRHDNQSQGIGFGYQSIYAAGSNSTQPINIISKGSAAITLNAYSYSTGNVGVGITAPNAKLHVAGSLGQMGDWGILVIGDNNVSTSNGLSMGYDNTNNWGWLYARTVGSTGRTIDINNNIFATWNGGVGIWTPSPGNNLLNVSNPVAQSSTNTAGAGISLTGQTGNGSGGGGAISIAAGTGGSGGGGGSVTITGGTNGTATFSGGGNVTISGGNANTSSGYGVGGGALNLSAGNCYNAGGSGGPGNVNISAGGNYLGANTLGNISFYTYYNNSNATATTLAMQVNGATNGVNIYNELAVSNTGTTTGSTSTGTILLGDGTISKTYGSGFIFNSTITAGGFTTSSDERIKNIIGISNPLSDLQTLNKIKITDYTMRDEIKDGALYKKVIAQQVQGVFPQAVKTVTTPQVIPNIYQAAENFNVTDGNLTVTLAKPVDMNKDIKPGSICKLVMYEKANGERKEMKGSITSVHGNEMAIKMSDAIETDKYDNRLFVYGTEINDLLTVDYDAISMLNVSATQELARKVKTLEEENTRLKEENERLNSGKADAEDVNAKFSQMKAQLDDLKQLMEKNGIRGER